MAVESYVEQFLENSRRMRDQIRSSPEVMDQIGIAIGGANGANNPYSWLDGTYCRLIAGELGLKQRDAFYLQIAVSVKADLYLPDLPITSFAVVLHGPSKEDLYQYYLVQDLGNVWDVDDPNLIKRNPQFVPELERLEAHLESKGYHECPDSRYHSLGFSGERIVLHDLDCKVMIKHDQILRGAISGKGEFGYLNGIYQRLASPEFSLEI
ncbi:MAG: hypothetical protein WCV90_08045 [Candidatus Woesearchaeota archaeon]|jgi:hypothetical protein